MMNYPFQRHPNLKQRIDFLISNNQASLLAIDVDSETYNLYHNLTISPDAGLKVIGPREAASIALAKTHNGIVASNNLRDINVYISEFGLKHITTGDILVEALEKGLITENQGNNIWNSMLAKRRKLGASSFSEYLNTKIR